MSKIVEFEYPVFEKGLLTTATEKKKQNQPLLLPPPIEPSERKAGEEMPPRRSVAGAIDSKRLFFQNIDRENPNGLPRQLAPSVQELRDQVMYRDAKGRKYALVSEREYAYLQGTIDAILRAHSSPSQQNDAVFMWVILPPSKRKKGTTTAATGAVSWPMINELLQLETTIPVFKLQQQQQKEKKITTDGNNDTTLLKPVKQPPYRFEASVIAVASGGPAQQWHQRKTSWAILIPTIKGKGKGSNMDVV
jgi:hypothetical protein